MIEFNNVSKNYGATKALKDVSFRIKNGQIFGLIGHNGAGKSTAIKILVSILNQTTGTVHINGKLLDEIYLEEEYRNKGIGTKIIMDILNNNDVVYLWVYKENEKAISLYKKLGFNVIKETESRYYMKYNK